MLEIETGSTRSPSVENLLWKRLWTCGKTDNRMNEDNTFLSYNLCVSTLRKRNS